MAKIKNETNLILKLAKEKMRRAPKLKEETEFRMQPGNYPERVTIPDAIKYGYNLAVQQYEQTLVDIVVSLENR